MGPITPVQIKTVWVSGFDLLQPVHVTKVRVHVKKNVVVPFSEKYLLQQSLLFRCKGHSRSGCSSRK